MAFEEEFGCEIPDDAAETILTVGDAVKFLEKNAKSMKPADLFDPTAFTRRRRMRGVCAGFESVGRRNRTISHRRDSRGSALRRLITVRRSWAGPSALTFFWRQTSRY